MIIQVMINSDKCQVFEGESKRQHTLPFTHVCLSNTGVCSVCTSLVSLPGEDMDTCLCVCVCLRVVPVTDLP